MASAICHPTVNCGWRLDSGILEHHRDARAPDAPDPLGGHGQQVGALETSLPGDVRTADELEERLSGHRLTRAGLPDDADRLAFADVERDAANGLDVAIVRRERHPEVAHRQQRITGQELLPYELTTDELTTVHHATVENT